MSEQITPQDEVPQVQNSDDAEIQSDDLEEVAGGGDINWNCNCANP